MAWDSKYLENRKLEIKNGQVNIYLYHAGVYYETLYVGNAVSARWEGLDLIVTLADGTVRRYINKNSYVSY